MLIDDWHPVTQDIGLINAPVDRVVAEFLTWREGIGMGYSRSVKPSLSKALASLAPLSAELRRALFLPAGHGWSAFLQSGIQGSDPFPVMSYLATRLGVLSMRVCATPSEAKWPAVVWEVYGPAALGGQEPLGFVRSIAASNDGGRWVFLQSGAPYPFENVEAYSRPKKKDRFTREMLAGYLAEFALFPFEDSFYPVSAGSPAVLLERLSRWENPPPEFSLEQAIEGFPWRQQ